MSQISMRAEELATGARTAVSLALEAFRGAHEDPAIFVMPNEAEALVEALNADQLRAAGDRRPLLGVPVTIKDNFDLAGRATTAGSVVLAEAQSAATDAVAVTKLRNAGLVVLGRTGMTEFAFSGLGLNPHYGTPLNPAYQAEQRIAGGSSSGAAASVARGLVPAALGTDTGGSVRIPAAFCGLVGFKPSAWIISRDGVLPLSTALDAVGIIATSVSDCRLLFDIVREDSPSSDLTKPELASLRLGAVSNYVRDDEERTVGAAFEKALKRLTGSGIRITEVAIPELDGINDIAPQASFSAAEAAVWHRELLVRCRNLYDPRVLARILPGLDVDETELSAMAERRQTFIDSFQKAAAPFDALLWPTVPMIAPRLQELGDDAAYHSINLRVLRNSAIVNLADGCAISLPCHDECDAPVGLTVAAPNGSDDTILNIASMIEPILQAVSKRKL